MTESHAPEPSLEEHLEREAIYLDATDPLAARINRGYLQFMQDPEAYALIHGLREEKRQQQPFLNGHNSRQLRYGFHHQLMESNLGNLRPELFPTIDGVTDFLHEILQDEQRLSAFIFDHTLDPRTPKPERYYGLLLASVLFADRDKGLLVTDFGCCNNTGSALVDIATRTDRSVLMGDLLPPPPTLERATTYEQIALHSLFSLACETPLERASGLDIFHPNDPLIRKFTNACSPTKRLFDADYQAFLAILTAHADNSHITKTITFSPYDFSKPRFYETPPRQGGQYILSDGSKYRYEIDPLPMDKKGDISHASFALYMHGLEKRRAIIDNMIALGETVVVLDAVKSINRRRKKHPADQLVFSNEWAPHDFRLLAYSPEKTNGEWVSIATAREGDFRQIQPGPILQAALREAA